AKIPRAQVAWYDHGAEEGAQDGHKNNTRGLVSWIRDAWLVWRWGWKLLGRESVFIGINNLHATVGILLKWLGKGRTVVYYVIDYTPQRFPNPFINALYQRVARFASAHADMVWNLSERMRTVHRRFKARESTSIMVPIGLDTQEFTVVPEAEVIRHQWVVVSTLFESKGVQLAIAGLSFVPEATLVIVGTGPYRAELDALAERLGVSARVKFLGLTGRKELYAALAHSRVALAPYLPDPANYSYYADPAKPKEYLACGVPTVITRVPWIAEVIEAEPMGFAIDYDAKQLADACRRLMDDNILWRHCRENALEFTRDLAWEIIFDRAFAELAELPARVAKSKNN
ncbi:MAG: glycosyltransferase, partial [Candidatus Firestonebacteria bacterium]|nr:glycosyltransferase [Candidatus Firestonebacteria bacterium]